MIFQYTGIGSRDTPREICQRMTSLAKELNRLGFTLRSGGASGADTAFEEGAGDEKKIFLPWKGFNGNSSKFYEVGIDALWLAAKVYNKKTVARPHPGDLNTMKQSVQKLMGRNCYQVLDLSLEKPSDFLLCWTNDGAETLMERTRDTGGTGQAIALASISKVRVFNMQRDDWEERFYAHLEHLLG